MQSKKSAILTFSFALVVAGSRTLPRLPMSEGNFSITVVIHGTRANSGAFSVKRASRLPLEIRVAVGK